MNIELDEDVVNWLMCEVVPDDDPRNTENMPDNLIGESSLDFGLDDRHTRTERIDHEPDCLKWPVCTCTAHNTGPNFSSWLAAHKAEADKRKANVCERKA